MARKPSAKPEKKAAPKRKNGKAEPALTVPDSPEISNEEIARRAYSLWESRGRPIGSPDEDWHQAIEEIRAGH